MSDPAVDRWRQEGRVFLWRYREGTRDYPGWHMHADEAGCRSLLSLLQLVKQARWPSTVVITTSRPTSSVLMIPNNRGGEAAWTAVQSLKLKYARKGMVTTHWSLHTEGPRAVLSLGEHKLDALEEGISTILNGGGDYSIGPDSDNSGSAYDETCLWFW